MPTNHNNQRLAVLVRNASSATLHLIFGNSERGMVFFACERAPLWTLQSYGLPSRCPVCSNQNPLKRKCCADDALNLRGPQV
jgi:hypothetical protein